ncbi:hypothetical protein TOPH_05492, partial [Tolypocladium ophioglossoides CBS 100239]
MGLDLNRAKLATRRMYEYWPACCYARHPGNGETGAGDGRASSVPTGRQPLQEVWQTLTGYLVRSTEHECVQIAGRNWQAGAEEPRPSRAWPCWEQARAATGCKRAGQGSLAQRGKEKDRGPALPMGVPEDSTTGGPSLRLPDPGPCLHASALRQTRLLHVCRRVLGHHMDAYRLLSSSPDMPPPLGGWPSDQRRRHAVSRREQTVGEAILVRVAVARAERPLWLRCVLRTPTMASWDGINDGGPRRGRPEPDGRRDGRRDGSADGTAARLSRPPRDHGSVLSASGRVLSQPAHLRWLLKRTDGAALSRGSGRSNFLVSHLHRQLDPGALTWLLRARVHQALCYQSTGRRRRVNHVLALRGSPSSRSCPRSSDSKYGHAPWSRGSSSSMTS